MKQAIPLFYVLYKIIFHLFKRMMYPAIYHKSEDKTRILMPESLPQHPTSRISYPYGFENDLDGGLPFWPAQMISEKEMMCVTATSGMNEVIDDGSGVKIPLIEYPDKIEIGKY